MNLKLRLLSSILFLITSLSVSHASAQFGQNKVRFKQLDWQYSQTQHCKVLFHQNIGPLPEITTHWLELDYSHLQTKFGFTHSRPVPLIIHGNPGSFEQTNVIGDIIPEEVGGFTEQIKNRIVVPFGGSYSEYRHVIHHELVHAFQFGILFEQKGSRLFGGSDLQLPLWFAEGGAEYLSSRWDADADMFLMDATINGSVALPGPDMGGYMVYKGGQSFLYFLNSTRGDTLFNSMLHRFRDTRKVDASIESVYDKKTAELGIEWQQELRRLYWPEIGRRQDLKSRAIALTSHEKDNSFFNLKPRISPDGKRIAWFSDKKDNTCIFISDRTGKVLRQINQHGYGGYFASFRPFRTGMCWAPDSRRLAFVTSQGGKEIIRIVDVEARKLDQIIDPKLEGIASPDWSSDGKQIVFGGLSQGQSDLYIYSFADKKIARLTNDLRYEATPRFSPGADRVIYSIEDTCGSVNKKLWPNGITSDLCIMDIASKTTTQLTSSPLWDEKQPCFSPDGKQIVFVSNRSGLQNIYISTLDSLDAWHALSDIVGGCSDPDWSTQGDALVFTLFAKQGWDVWMMDKPRSKILDHIPLNTEWMSSVIDSTHPFFVRRFSLADSVAAVTKKATSGNDITVDSTSTKKQSITDTASSDITVFDSTDSAFVVHTFDTTHLSIGQKAPADSFSNSLDTASDSVHAYPAMYLRDTTSILEKFPFSPHPYKLEFSPDVVSLGMALSAWYGAAGQVQVVFSDLLGDHQIAFMGDVQGDFSTFVHLYASYLNLKYRCNFGMGGFYYREYTSSNISNDLYYHDTHIGAVGMVRYPFSRNLRLDFSVYYRNTYREPQVVHDNKLDTDTTRSAYTVNLLLPALSSVFDNVVWGLTGPVNGLRGCASLMVSPPINSFDAPFASFDFDVRKYWHINRRFVWVNRVAAGASFALGSSSESARRFFLGGTEYWLFSKVNQEKYRTNESNIFYSDLVVPFRGWDYLDLTGSRFAVYNTEFRFPFIKDITVVWPIPMSIRYINGCVFTDVGNAWDAADQQTNFPLPRNIYGGVGFGLRVNLGIAVLRFDRAWKTDFEKFIGPPISYFSLGAEF